MLSVQECEVDDTEERISRLFFLADTTGAESLRFLGRYPVEGIHGAYRRGWLSTTCNVSPGAEDAERWEEMEHHSTTFVTFGNAERLVFSKLYFFSYSYAFSHFICIGLLCMETIEMK